MIKCRNIHCSQIVKDASRRNLYAFCRWAAVCRRKWMLCSPPGGGILKPCLITFLCVPLLVFYLYHCNHEFILSGLGLTPKLINAHVVFDLSNWRVDILLAQICYWHVYEKQMFVLSNIGMWLDILQYIVKLEGWFAFLKYTITFEFQNYSEKLLSR